MTVEVDINGTIREDVARAEAAADRAEAGQSGAETAQTAAEAALAVLEQQIGVGVVVSDVDPDDPDALETLHLNTTSSVLFAPGGFSYQFTSSGGGGGGGGGGGDGGGTGEIPPGALGIWYADQIVDADQDPESETYNPIPYIPNSLAPSPVPLPSLVNCPRGEFSRGLPWRVRTNVTIVDFAATAADGSTTASTLVASAGSWALGVDLNVNGPTIICVSVKRKSSVSSDQSFQIRMGDDASGELIATAAWQRFTLSVDVSGPVTTQCYLRDFGGAAAQLEFNDFYIFRGDVDLAGLTPPPRGSHLYIGEVWNNTDIQTVTDGLLDTQAATLDRRSFIQFPTASTFGGLTAVFLTSEITEGNFGALLDTPGGDTQLMTRFSGAPMRWKFNADLGGLPVQQEGTLRLTGEGVHAVAFRYDGDHMDTFIDDAHWIRRARTLGSISVRDWYAGQNFNKTNTWMLWNSALTNTELRSAIYAAKARALAAASVTVDFFDKVVICEGDSMTQPYAEVAATAYPSLIGELCDPVAQVTSPAIPGDTLAILQARADEWVQDAIPLALGGRLYVVTILTGANDLPTYVGGTDAYIADLKTLCDTYRSRGAKVVLLTQLSRTTVTGGVTVDAEMNSRRAVVRAAMLDGNLDGHCDAVADIAADSDIGPDGACLNTTYFHDGVHPKTAAHAIIAPIVAAAIDSL
jgi:lysophospholipase L1-like esterase